MTVPATSDAAATPVDVELHVVIPAGGSGTRLWPLSRAGRPKFLLDLTGSGRTLLQQTVDRLTPLAGPGNVMVVTGVKHAEAVAEQVELAPGNLVTEPSPRDSMAAIGLAAAILQQRHGPVVLGSFAADHVIVGQEKFRNTVREAVTAAQDGYVVTIGIDATEPSTAFGYIRAGDRLGIPGAPSARKVRGFTEKPDGATARAYLASGEYRWNAGMFVVRTDILLGHVRAFDAALADGLVAIATAWDTPQRGDVLEEIWPTLRKIAIDNAVAEPAAAAGGVAMVPGAFRWDDVGDVAALANLIRPSDDAGTRVLGSSDQVLTVDSRATFAAVADGRQVVVLGLDGIVVIDTPDAVLVTTRARAQDVKKVVEQLRATGHTDLL